MPSVAEPCDATQRGLAVPADPDRRMRLLHRMRQALDRIEPVELPGERGRRLGPQRLEDPDVLVADRAAPVEGVRAERVELILQPAHADAHGDASLRQHVDGRQRLRGEDRIAIRQDHHARHEAEPRRLRRDEGHEAQLLEGVALPREAAVGGVRILRVDLHGEHDVVRDHRRRKAQRLRAPPQSLERLRRRRLTARGQVEAVSHGHGLYPTSTVERGRRARYPDAMTLTFRPLHPHFAAEVGPVDLRRVDDEKTLAEIRGGMDEYAVLVFRDQPFADEEQLAFAQRLDGVLHTKLGISALQKNRFGNEALGDISNLGGDGEILQQGDRRRAYGLGNRLWHTDASFQDPAGRYSMLSARIVPPAGADTEYADMRAAYDALPAETKRTLEGLRVHYRSEERRV